MTDISVPGTHHGYGIGGENAAEMERLMVQNQMLDRSLGGPLPEQTDLGEVHQVLDVACGPGGWIFDVVQRYPFIQGVGIDIDQLMIDFANSQQIANARFRVMDATGPL